MKNETKKDSLVDVVLRHAIAGRPFEITVTQEFLDILKGAGGWMIEIPYKIGERLTIYVREEK